MRRRRTLRGLGVSAAMAFGGLSVDGAWGCSVCGGDPASPLTQGALSGVLFMVILTYAVVLGLAAAPILWAVRSRRLRRRQPREGEAEAGKENP